MPAPEGRRGILNDKLRLVMANAAPVTPPPEAPVLLTGATGYLGRRVLELLLESGYRVRALVRRPAPELEALGAETAPGDLGDEVSLDRAARGVSAVVHCAAKTGVWGPAEEYMSANFAGTLNMLEAARGAGARVFVHASSPSAVYDGRDLAGINEDYAALPPPRFPYARSKALAEREVLAAASPGFRTAALRPHLVWGPGDTHFLPRLVSLARAGRLRLFKGASYTVDPTYIDDAARAHVLALRSLAASGRASGKAFFLGQGEPVDSRDFINRLLAAAGAPPVAVSVHPAVGRLFARVAEVAWKILARGGEPPLTYFTALQLTTSHYFDLSRARELLGYEPQVSQAEGMRRLAESLVAGGGPGGGNAGG
ncbi:MAG: NAD-dependent epimerase/dehydratase family protein [Deltaproteobacteria bacterium]|jgi:nucleoside-diphosphate-sugar epimerase|nr:NAD-dependent epimerase/dehydratase family protein [Deltaproteobacteria bacterium]